MVSQKYMFTVIVASCNEAHYLDQCLSAFKNVDQLIFVDLESEDNSIDVAKRYTNEIYTHERVPIAEFLIADYIGMFRNDWFIRPDPDEVYPEILLQRINEMIIENPDAARISIPVQYYFLGKPLNCTIWGGVRYIGDKVINKSKVVCKKRVHGAFVFDGEALEINDKSISPMKHYWVDSIKDMNEKHNRYLLLEGKSMYERGNRFVVKKLFWLPLVAFIKGFIVKKGILGGWVGWFLSFYYALYVFRSWTSLYKYQAGLKKLTKHG